MILNCYEHNLIKNKLLPDTWQNSETINELSEFLQQSWEQRAIFFEDGEISSKQQFIQFLHSNNIKTKNYIGTIVFKGKQLNIFPKMFKIDKDDTDTDELNQDHLMMNLIKWLEYCNKMAYPFINITTELEDATNLRELYITLYIGHLKHAMKRSAFYQYIDETADCNLIKGTFDFKDYITLKYPYKKLDKFKCSYSTFEFDNKVNQIIKYTCKYLFNITSSKNKKELRNIIMRLEGISDVACNPRDCEKIKLSKQNQTYDIVLAMSKMFLLNKLSNYTIDNNDSFCFLFPAELLFEGFIGGFIKDIVKINKGKVFLQKSDMSLIENIKYGDESLGSAFQMRHDILLEINGKSMILDTKYKGISRFESNRNDVKDIITNELSQNDLYQICEYARKRNLNDVYLLYPMYRYEDIEPIFPIGYSNEIRIHFVRLPFIFEKDNNNTEELLKEIIIRLIKE